MAPPTPRNQNARRCREVVKPDSTLEMDWHEQFAGVHHVHNARRSANMALTQKG
jgi:hypothetical protein